MRSFSHLDLQVPNKAFLCLASSICTEASLHTCGIRPRPCLLLYLAPSVTASRVHALGSSAAIGSCRLQSLWGEVRELYVLNDLVDGVYSLSRARSNAQCSPARIYLCCSFLPQASRHYLTCLQCVLLRVVFLPFVSRHWIAVFFCSNYIPRVSALVERHLISCCRASRAPFDVRRAAPHRSRHIHCAHLDRSLPGHRLNDHTLLTLCFVFTRPKRKIKDEEE